MQDYYNAFEKRRGKSWSEVKGSDLYQEYNSSFSQPCLTLWSIPQTIYNILHERKNTHFEEAID